MQVNRVELLQALNHVRAGLSSNEVTDQSDAVIFSDGNLVTYNEHYLVMVPFEADIKGAVRAEELIGILSKLSLDTVDMTTDGGKLIIRAGRSKSGIRFEENLRLPVADVLADSKQAEMVDVDDTLLTALQRAQFCAAPPNRLDEPQWRGLHVKDGVVEALDGFRAIRVWLDNEGVKSLPEFLLPAVAVKQMGNLALTKVGITDAWAHFGDDNGLLFSVRLLPCYDFPDMDRFFEYEGEDVPLPAGLLDAIDKSTIFTKHLPAGWTTKAVTVTVRPGRVVLRGEGVFGWYEENVVAEGYEGDPIEFSANPDFLRAILPSVEKTTLCKANSRGSMTYGTAIFSGDNFKHVMVLCSLPAKDEE